MIVVDASAVLALVDQERGWQVVASAAAGQDATISTVNHTEVVQKCARQSVPAEVADTVLDALGVTVTPFGAWMRARRPRSPVTARG